ncbi:MAG: WYL domain-containing protein [Bacteroidales bacterium]
MPAHKSKNFRYRIIDECLQNTDKKWSLEDLISAVSQKLTQEFGVQKVSKRSIQYDIALMREKPPIGYNAPIQCTNGYYTYSDPDFSITNKKLSKPDIDNLTEVVNTLKQYKQYTHLGDVHKIIEKIEAIIAINPGPETHTVSFETTQKLLKGISWLHQIFKAVEKKEVLELTIKEINEDIHQFFIHPYFIKEYNSEWYLFGLLDDTKNYTVIPVQKIAAISPQITTYIEPSDFNPQHYFDSIVGISPAEGTKPSNITLRIDKDLKEEFLISPLHHSQEITDVSEEGALLHIKVIPNTDLRKIILRHGSQIKVESPEKLRKAILKELKEAHDAYYTLSLF